MQILYICAVIGAFIMGGYITLTAFKQFTFYFSSIKGFHFEAIDFTSFQHSILSIRLLCTFFPLINEYSS